MIETIDGIPVFGEPVDQGALAQIRRTLEGGADRVALMADHHKGYGVPVGGVVASKGSICIAGVGFDIACGNKAVRTDMTIESLRPNLKAAMDLVWSALSFGVGLKNNEHVDHELFDDPLWQGQPLADLYDKARAQLGTIGSGNHYVDLFADEQGQVWIGVHFGSRGLGHCIATHFMKESGENPNIMDEVPKFVGAETSLGSDYFAHMELAGRYAYAGRDWVCSRVAGILGAKITYEVHNHHNFCWKEDVEGESMFVVRKGATPAFPGQEGFVGATMGEPSVILEGVAHPDAARALNSTVHGAGRLMSRTQAAGKVKWMRNEEGVKRPVRVTAGLIDYDEVRAELRGSGLELRGGGADEAPAAYKRLPEVLAHHCNTVKIMHTLTPVGVAMAGEETFDPYKD